MKPPSCNVCGSPVSILSDVTALYRSSDSLGMFETTVFELGTIFICGNCRESLLAAFRDDLCVEIDRTLRGVKHLLRKYPLPKRAKNERTPEGDNRKDAANGA